MKNSIKLLSLALVLSCPMVVLADAPATMPAVQASTQIGGVTWMDDYDQALADAKKSGKMVLLHFTGSDWCGPCIALKKNVLTSDVFNAWAKDKIICVEMDYPHNVPQTAELKARNQAVLVKFNGTMIPVFPTTIILNGDGKELARNTGYNTTKPPTAEEWVAMMQKKLAPK